jgi:hypothetical protein
LVRGRSGISKPTRTGFVFGGAARGREHCVARQHYF